MKTTDLETVAHVNGCPIFRNPETGKFRYTLNSVGSDEFSSLEVAQKSLEGEISDAVWKIQHPEWADYDDWGDDR